jgi:hypothetical protein
MTDQHVQSDSHAHVDQDAGASSRVHDLPRWLTWFLIPAIGLSVILLLVLELMLGSEAMQSGLYPQRGGQTMTWYELLTFKEGPAEYAAVLMLCVGIGAGLYAVARRKRFPDKRLGVWALIMALGLFYFAGEELSWGHHIMVSLGYKQAQAETVTILGVNEQGETNIHNLDTWYGKLLGRGTKNIIELWCYIGALIIPLVLARRKPPLPTSDPGYWFWPSTATVVCAVMVFLTYRPVRFYVKMFPYESEPYWARQSELQEFFMAATLVIYISSIAWRLRQMPDPSCAAA